MHYDDYANREAIIKEQDRQKKIAYDKAFGDRKATLIYEIEKWVNAAFKAHTYEESERATIIVNLGDQVQQTVKRVSISGKVKIEHHGVSKEELLKTLKAARVNLVDHATGLYNWSEAEYSFKVRRNWFNSLFVNRNWYKIVVRWKFIRNINLD